MHGVSTGQHRPTPCAPPPRSARLGRQRTLAAQPQGQSSSALTLATVLPATSPMASRTVTGVAVPTWAPLPSALNSNRLPPRPWIFTSSLAPPARPSYLHVPCA